MSVAAGTINYQLGTAPVIGCGFSYSADELNTALSGTKPPEDWRVGEALAETYLVDQKDCFFPWPDGRDERKSGSSLPGAMHGRTGLKQQLEDLKDDVKIKDDIFRYLGFRAQKSSWEDRFKRAAKNYIQSKTNVRVFGFLVRDVEPNQDDLRTRVTKLAKDQHADMVIELLALYLPQNSIGQLSNSVVSSRSGGVV